MSQSNSELRNSFVSRFGGNNALKLEWASETHKNGVHDDPGSDYFRWAVLICIGSKCISHDQYRKHHTITITPEQFNAWVKEHRDYFMKHDDDVDYLSLAAGVYKEILDV